MSNPRIVVIRRKVTPLKLAPIRRRTFSPSIASRMRCHAVSGIAIPPSTKERGTIFARLRGCPRFINKKDMYRKKTKRRASAGPAVSNLDYRGLAPVFGRVLIFFDLV